MADRPIRTGRGPLRTAARAGLLVAVPAVAAWATGAPAVFPSLGPSAYLLATRSDESVAPRRVVGGHVVGVVAGLAAHAALAPGLALAPTAPLAADWLWLGASAVASVALTAGGMAAAGVEHPPAAATTLILSLGVLAGVVEGGIVVASVVVLVGADAALSAAGEFGAAGRTPDSG